MPGIEPGAFHMQSERSTTEPHPPIYNVNSTLKIESCANNTGKVRASNNVASELQRIDKQQEHTHHHRHHHHQHHRDQ